MHTEHGIPIRNLWHMLLYAWNEVPQSPYWQLVEVEKSPTLDALLVSILVRLVKQRLRIGLGCEYLLEEKNLRGVRGRINFTKSIKNHAFERGQSICEFERYSINAPKNQIIRSTLGRMAQVGQFGADRIQAELLRQTIRRVVHWLDGVDLIELTPEIIHRQQAKRHDRDYRIMLSICDLILQRRLPTEEINQTYFTGLARERLVLHNVYERFVANFYSFHLNDWVIQPQSPLIWYEKSPSAYLPQMRPDLFMKEKSSGRTVIVDTKFTPKSLVENRWGKEMFNSGHLYQIYTYLKTQEQRAGRFINSTGILLYPSIKEKISEKIELQEHQIRIECVDLADSWENIEKSLKDLILDKN